MALYVGMEFEIRQAKLVLKTKGIKANQKTTKPTSMTKQKEKKKITNKHREMIFQNQEKEILKAVVVARNFFSGTLNLICNLNPPKKTNI